jgi:hypothetical protein
VALRLLNDSTMIAVLIIMAFVAAGLIIGLVATAAAPVGYEDETGFHYGPEQDGAHEELTCGVTQPKLA